MACIVAAIKSGGFGFSAMGGIAGGMGGLANAAGPISSAISSVAPIAAQVASVSSLASVATALPSVAAIVSSGGNPLASVTSGLSGAMNSIGAATSLGTGSITGVLGSGFDSIGGTSFAAGLTSHAGELFGSGPLQMIQTLGGAEAFSAISADIAGPMANALTGQFGGAISSITKALPLDGNFGNFLGSAIPDMNSLVTNGLTNFMPNLAIPGFAGDLVNLGSSFDLGDLTNFGNPGQLVGNLLNQGAGGITGLTAALGEVGLDTNLIANLASSEYNDILNDAMSRITNPEMIANAQAMLGSNIPGLKSMADFTDLSKILPTSFNDIIPDTIDQFREEIQAVDIGSISIPKDLGNLVGSLQTVSFDAIKDFTDVVDPEAALQIASDFLGGSGTNSAVTVTDIIGSVGGVGIKAANTAYQTAMAEMDDLGAFGNYNTLQSQMQAGIAGSYTTGSGTYGVDTIEDPEGGSYDDLDAFVAAKKSQIEAEVSNIANNSTWSGAFGAAKSNFTTMQNKILTEDINQAKTDLHLAYRNNAPDNAYSFIAGLTDKVADPDKLALIQGMTDANPDNKWKEYMQGATAEAQNINQMEAYGIIPRASKIA